MIVGKVGAGEWNNNLGMVRDRQIPMVKVAITNVKLSFTSFPRAANSM